MLVTERDADPAYGPGASLLQPTPAQEAHMKKLFITAALFLATTSAYAGNGCAHDSPRSNYHSSRPDYDSPHPRYNSSASNYDSSRSNDDSQSSNYDSPRSNDNSYASSYDSPRSNYGSRRQRYAPASDQDQE
jgi:hypothetical protein